MKKSVWIERLPRGYSVRYWEASSVRREWFATHNEAQARKAKVKLKLLAAQQGLIDPTLTPIDCLQVYLKDIGTVSRASTLKMKETNLTRFLKDLGSMTDLNETFVRTLKERLLKDYSVSSVSIYLREIRAFCNWAMKNNYLREYPFTNVRIPKGAEIGRKLELEELRGIIEAADARFKPYLMFLIHTGARRGEICKAKWAYINFHNKTWIIPKEDSKTKEPRTIPLNDKVIEALKLLPREGELVFKDWTLFTPRWYLRKALKKAKISGRVRIHDFRHTFASHWNGRPGSLMEWVGWKSASMIKRYSHFSVADLRKEAQEKSISSQI